MQGERAFHQELRAAIAASGLSLDRIRERLRVRGTPVSAATLSCWQSGRHQPERQRSLTALAALEDVLALPPAALSARLAPPRPRGRWLPPGEGHPELAQTWRLGAARHAVDVRWDSALTRLSCHNRAEVDVEGRLRSLSSRRLLRAEADGADRWIALYRADTPGPLPHVRLSPPARLGNIVELPEEGLIVAELLFERALARGETVIVDYTLTHAGPRPFARQVETAIHVPMREHLLEVAFTPGVLPRGCWSFRTAGLGAEGVRREQRLRLDASGVVHAVGLGVGGCRFGIRWVW